jgi:hypothetical protein
MRRFVYSFVCGWALTVVVVLPLLRPEIWDDYVRLIVLGLTGPIAFLIVGSALYYQRRPTHAVNPWLIWTMGLSYLTLLPFGVQTSIERQGEAINWVLPLLAVSYVCVLVWLVPLFLRQRSLAADA